MCIYCQVSVYIVFNTALSHGNGAQSLLEDLS